MSRGFVLASRHLSSSTIRLVSIRGAIVRTLRRSKLIFWTFRAGHSVNSRSFTRRLLSSRARYRTPYKKLAVWFGNEGKGISKAALERSDLCINIPMFGIIESFNLGTSSGIVLYEITKQRRVFQFNLKKKIAGKKLEKT
jgi:tRNA G18 (ribose-2'-O)-methylase SpoU